MWANTSARNAATHPTLPSELRSFSWNGGRPTLAVSPPEGLVAVTCSSTETLGPGRPAALSRQKINSTLLIIMLPQMGHVVGTVRESMSSPVETVTSDSTVAAAAQIITTDGIGSLVITGGEQLGIVTKTDLLDVLASTNDPETTPVGAVASTPVVTVAADAPLSTAANRMDEHDVKHLIVTDNGPVGVLTTTDVLAALASDTEELVNEFMPAQ